MQTSAQPTPAPTPSWPQATYTGKLVEQAQARIAVTSDAQAQAVPVLCMTVELDNDYRIRLDVEQPFPPGHFTQAEIAAHRLTKGTRVTVQTPLLGMRLVARNASHVHIVKDQPKDPA